MVYSGAYTRLWIERHENGLKVHTEPLYSLGVEMESPCVVRNETWQVFFQNKVSKKTALRKLKAAMLKDALKLLTNQIKYMGELESLSE